MSLAPKAPHSAAQPRPPSGGRPDAPPEPDAPTLREVFGGADGAATGFVLARLPAGPVLWVQDRTSRREGGRPHAAGLAHLLGRPVDLLWIEARRPVDVLWAMEEALGCAALGAVVGEVWGDPPSLGFTATKRLALRAERGGVPAWLLRRAGRADLSAARERWRLAPLPSPPAPDDGRAPGTPLWQATLARGRGRMPGDWVAGVERGRLALGHAAAGAAPAARAAG